MQSPEEFRAEAGQAQETIHGRLKLHLLPYALVRIDWSDSSMESHALLRVNSRRACGDACAARREHGWKNKRAASNRVLMNAATRILAGELSAMVSVKP